MLRNEVLAMTGMVTLFKNPCEIWEKTNTSSALSKIDGLVKSLIFALIVIPAKAGIQ